METENPRIQELIDLIVEKLFTASLLVGKDADSEFAKGIQAVEKAAQVLLSVSLDTEYLAEGLTQLVEQRLPDRRVIENFPNFPWLMQQMILEGTQVLQARPAQASESEEKEPMAVQASARVLLVGGRTPVLVSEVPDGRIALRPHMRSGETKMPAEAGVPLHKIDVQTSSPDDLVLNDPPVKKTLSTRTADVSGLASSTGEEHGDMPREVGEGAQSRVAEKPIEKVAEKSGNTAAQNVSENLSEKLTDKATDKLSKKKTEMPVLRMPSRSGEKQEHLPRGVSRPGGMPPEAARLSYVLKKEFPRSAVRWDFVVAGHRFLAQVEDVLIYVLSEEKPPVPKLETEGWHIVACTPDDLAFPRRMERFIHLARFSGFKVGN